MPIRPPEYDAIAAELKPKLENLPPVIIAISGSMSAGKTTLARFLAWYFNISLIETDFYLKPNEGLTYDASEIARMISFRIGLSRPVVVEGLKILEILAEINKAPDITIHVQKKPNYGNDKESEYVSAISGFSDASCYKVEVSH